MKVYASSPSHLATGGHRAGETRQRVIDRVIRVFGSYPSSTLVTQADDADLVVTIGSNETAIERRPRHWASVRIVRYNSSLPGTAARMVGDSLHAFVGEFLVDQTNEQVRVSASLHADIERLTADLSEALDDNHQLRAQLEDARIEIDFLRRAVGLLSEATRTGRPALTKRVLMVVCGVLLAATTGMAEAGASVVLDRVLTAPTPAHEFLVRCESIAHSLDSIEWPGDQFPSPA